MRGPACVSSLRAEYSSTFFLRNSSAQSSGDILAGFCAMGGARHPRIVVVAMLRWPRWPNAAIAGCSLSPQQLCSQVMSEVTRILSAIEQGDQHAAEQLLPLVYDELRQLAAQKLAHEKPGQTLEPTALVHEAYLRLVAGREASAPQELSWNSRGHFFGAAAEAMRRILVERARRKKQRKRGGDRRRVGLEEQNEPLESPPEERLALEEEILALDEALPRLAEQDPEAAQVVRLHFFAGLSIEQTAEALGVSRATAYRQWAYARAWLRCALEGPGTAYDF